MMSRMRIVTPRMAALATVLAALATAAGAAAPGFPLHPSHPDITLPGGANRFDYVSLDPSRKELFIAHLGSGMVTAVNLQTMRVAANVTDIPGVHGVLAVPKLGEVFAAATDRNRLDVISERTYRVIASAPAGVYPDGMAFAPPFNELFISDEAGRTETVVDTRTDRRVATIAMGGAVRNSQYASLTRQFLVYVQTRDEIVAIDPRVNTISARYRLPSSCDNDHSLLLDVPRRLAFVACDHNARLLLVDLRSMRVLSVYPVGRDPDVLAFDSGLQRLYVASESGVVAVFALEGERLRLLGRKYLAYEAHSVAVDSRTHRVYFPLQNVGGRGVLRIMAPTN